MRNGSTAFGRRCVQRIPGKLCAGLAATLLSSAPAAVAGPSRAILNTNDDGTRVNGNVYVAKEGVYT